MDDTQTDREFEIADMYRRSFASVQSPPTPVMVAKPPGRIKLAKQSRKPATVYKSQASPPTPEKLAEEAKIRAYYDELRQLKNAVTGQSGHSKLPPHTPTTFAPGT